MAPDPAIPAATAIPVVDVSTLLARTDALVVDLRSPGEFAEDHLPFAHNVALFDDAERALVGLLYKQASPDSAFSRGLELVLDRVGELVGELADLAGWRLEGGDPRWRVRELAGGGLVRLQSELTTRPWEDDGSRPVVLHCLRGGLRSRSMVALLRRLGCTQAIGLEGGYKAYRRVVREELGAWVAPPTFVLRGLTGVGKTLVLREVERLRPGWTLDLEAAAGHRSSLLGMVGLEPASQKAFESRLAARVRAGFPGPLVIEGESRRVGDAIVPRSVWEPLVGGANVLLVADVERRIDVLMEDYLGREGNRPQLRRQLAAVEARAAGRLPLVELLDAGRERELVALLLERYYDPRYGHGEKRAEYALEVDSGDPRRAAGEIVRWIEGRLPGQETGARGFLRKNPPLRPLRFGQS